MPVALEATLENETIRRKVWTREEYAEASRHIDLERYELIEGELLEKVSKNRPHVVLLYMLFQWAERTFGRGFSNQEAPVDVSADDNTTNEPEPDLAVYSKPIWAFKANPTASEVRLLVEISDSTLVGVDLTKKAKLYGRAGIVDYWVIDVQGRRLIVHREPQDNGTFGSVLSYREDEPVKPLAARETEFRLADLYKEEA